MRINITNKNVFVRFFVVFFLCFGLPILADAYVTGPCSLCHTMHSSQDNADVVHLSGPVGSPEGAWTAAGIMVGATSATPQDSLLVSDCVGCHSSTGSSSIVEMGGVGSGYKVPIVWNHVAPANELAGGNFFHVVGVANEGNGHNVKGINATASIRPAPGTLPGKGCADSCHISLVDDVTGIPNSGTSGVGANTTGCEGCHLKVGHHVRPSDPSQGLDAGPPGGAGDAFRFLSGHGDIGIVQNKTDSDGYYLEGVDWGVGGADVNANVYVGQAGSLVTDTDLQAVAPLISIGRWCAGCHNAFHAVGIVDDMTEEENLGDRDLIPGNTPWLRHPTNVNIPNAGEYSAVLGGAYWSSPLPLARTGTLSRTLPIGTADQVMCLSCHFAHGSPNPDALRFSYVPGTNMVAHNGTEDGIGCFYCHTEKDTP